MTVTLVVIAVVVLLVLVGVARRLTGEPQEDSSRFHHARELISTWSDAYQGVAEPEEPEASSGKPELQRSVHLVDA